MIINAICHIWKLLPRAVSLEKTAVFVEESRPEVTTDIVMRLNDAFCDMFRRKMFDRLEKMHNFMSVKTD